MPEPMDIPAIPAASATALARAVDGNTAEGVHETGIAYIGNAVWILEKALLGVGNLWHVAN